MDFSAKVTAKNKVKFSDRIEIIGFSQTHEISDQDKDTESKILEHESRPILHWSMFMKDNTTDTSEESDDNETWIEETLQISD